MKVIYLAYGPENRRSGSLGFCFPVFQVVVIRVGVYIEALKEPSCAELLVVVFYELVLA